MITNAIQKDDKVITLRAIATQAWKVWPHTIGFVISTWGHADCPTLLVAFDGGGIERAPGVPVGPVTVSASDVAPYIPPAEEVTRG